MAVLLAAAPAAADDVLPPPPVAVPPAATAPTSTSPPPVPVPSPDPPPVPVGPEAGEEIVIYGDLEVARLRGELEQAIRTEGYQEGVRRDDRTIFRPEVPWKPTVIVHDEGLVQLTRSPVRWMAPGRSDRPLNHLWCLPPFTPMCVRIGGQVVSKAKLDPQKNRVLTGTHDASEAWRQAIVDRATWARVNEELPGRIEATWRDGAPLEDGGPTLPDPAARRAALLSFWATRSDTREGDMVASVVADFLVQVVQASAWPVGADELAAANARAGGVRTLVLTPPPATPLPDPG